MDAYSTEDSDIHEAVSDVLDFIKIANFDPVQEAFGELKEFIQHVNNASSYDKKQNRQLKSIDAKSNDMSKNNEIDLDIEIEANDCKFDDSENESDETVINCKQVSDYENDVIEEGEIIEGVIEDEYDHKQAVEKRNNDFNQRLYRSAELNNHAGHRNRISQYYNCRRTGNRGFQGRHTFYSRNHFRNRYNAYSSKHLETRYHTSQPPRYKPKRYDNQPYRSFVRGHSLDKEYTISSLRHYYNEQLQSISDNIIEKAIEETNHNMQLSPEVKVIMQYISCFYGLSKENVF